MQTSSKESSTPRWPVMRQQSSTRRPWTRRKTKARSGTLTILTQAVMRDPRYGEEFLVSSFNPATNARTEFTVRKDENVSLSSRFEESDVLQNVEMALNLQWLFQNRPGITVHGALEQQ